MRVFDRNYAVTCGLLLFLWITTTGYALGPHQLVLLVNQQSRDSMTLANLYAQLRGIPPEHIIYLDPPAESVAPPYAIRLEPFEKSILQPVTAAIRQRGLPPIYAWIYSAGFPTKVITGSTDDLSIHGATFLRGIVPGAVAVKQGTYVSPLFAGPEMPAGTVNPAQTFDVSLRGMADPLPIPAMSLGFVGPGGNTLDEVSRSLMRGAMSDGTMPKGTIYFVKRDEIRSKSRDWQYEPIQKILTEMKIACVVGTNELAGKTDILGVQCGRAHVDPLGYGRYVPGAMAEHLTSCGAIFDDDSQSHCTKWISAGATASAGTVTEPYAIWSKFPASTFYVYYAQGCTVMESFYQSVRAPLQLFMIGDPLAGPWRKTFGVTLVALKDDPQTGSAEFFGQLMPVPPPNAGIRYSTFLDGRPVFHPAPNPMVSVDTAKLSDGYHRLRLVAEFGKNVIWSAFGEKGFTVNNHGRSVTLLGVAAREKVSASKQRALSVTFSGAPVRVGIVSGSRELVSQQAPKASPAELLVNAGLSGCGPVAWAAFAEYEDGERVLSVPVRLEVAE